MKRILAALAVVVAAAGVTLGLSGTALASTPADCTNSIALTATAQVSYTNALNVAVARAKELGFTSAQISLAQSILVQGNITDAQKAQLMMIYSEHISMLSVTSDLAKVKAVLDTRLALNAAIAARNIACAGMTAPVVTPAPAATPAMPVPVEVCVPQMTVPAVPCGAPPTGDGSSLAGN